MIGAIDIELDADNVVFQTREREDWFPFDRYSVTLNGYIDFCVEACDNEDFADNIWESLPIEIVPYTTSLPGWSSTLKIDNWVDETTNNALERTDDGQINPEIDSAISSLNSTGNVKSTILENPGQDLDLGFAIWRFLNSEFFVNLKSKLDDSDKIVLEKQIEKRLNIHLPTSPIIYSLANLEKNELLQNQKAFEDLNTRILSPALTKNFEGNWGRCDRAELLAQLYAWDENEKMTDLNLIKLKLRKFLHQIFKYKVLKRFLDGFYDRDIRDLPFPWLETEKISYN